MSKKSKESRDFVVSIKGLDRNLYHKVKVYCVDKNIKIYEFLNEAMKDRLSKSNKPSNKNTQSKIEEQSTTS